MLCKLVNVAQNQTFRNEVTNLTSAKEAFIVFRGSKFEKFEKLAPVFKVDHTSDESRKDLNGMVRTGI